jgi:hypothetical protein
VGTVTIFERALDHAAERWMVGHLERAYWLWDRVNDRSFAGQLSTPWIEIAVPRPADNRAGHAFADIGHGDDHGVSLLVRVHPLLLHGHDPDWSGQWTAICCTRRPTAGKSRPWAGTGTRPTTGTAAPSKPSWPRSKGTTTSTWQSRGGTPGDEADEPVHPQPQATAATAGLHPLRPTTGWLHARL